MLEVILFYYDPQNFSILVEWLCFKNTLTYFKLNIQSLHTVEILMKLSHSAVSDNSGKGIVARIFKMTMVGAIPGWGEEPCTLMKAASLQSGSKISPKFLRKD